MPSHEFEPEYDRWEDAEARYERDREAEHLEHRASLRDERLREHVTPDPRPPKRVKRRDSTAQRVHPSVSWKLEVLERDQGCCFHSNPADCDEGFQAHHVVKQQILRRQHNSARWRRESGMGLCGKAHRRFHGGIIVIAREQVPAECVEFLTGLGYGWYLERHYPETAAAAA